MAALGCRILPLMPQPSGPMTDGSPRALCVAALYYALRRTLPKTVMPRAFLHAASLPSRRGAIPIHTLPDQNIKNPCAKKKQSTGPKSRALSIPFSTSCLAES